MYRPQFPAPLAPVWPKRNINLRRAQGPPLKRWSLDSLPAAYRESMCAGFLMSPADIARLFLRKRSVRPGEAEQRAVPRPASGGSTNAECAGWAPSAWDPSG